MSAEHKQALAVGREESRAVRRYLEAVEAHKPKRGRKRTVDGIETRLTQIESRMANADALSRVHLAQERLNLQTELATKEDTFDLTALEQGFVQAARGHGERKGLTYGGLESGEPASMPVCCVAPASLVPEADHHRMTGLPSVIQLQDPASNRGPLVESTHKPKL